MGSTWILVRFELLPLGLSSASASAARGVLMWASSSCVRSPPSLALQADALRELVAVQDVLLQSTFPEMLPAGPTKRLRVRVWCPTQINRQGNGGPLGPHVVER